MPRRDRITSEYLDLQQYPDARTTYRPPRRCEVEETMKNVVPPECHKHVLKQTMQTYYAPVGKGVDRQLGIDQNELMGEQTYNDPENHVEGFLNDAYIDRGYTIRPLGQLRPEKTTRNIGHEFTLNKADNSTSKPAGVYEEHKEHITDILAKDYGEDPRNYDYACKCCKNVHNET